MKRRPPSLDKRDVKHRRLSQEEAKTWRVTMGEEKADAPDAPHLPEPPRKGTAASAMMESSDVKQKKQISPERLERRVHSKLRRGTAAIQATLDLHGHTKATAHAELIAFVETCALRGVSLALIITGKGKAGGGALRELLPRWLDETPLRERIIAYDVAGYRHGGAGAWYVRIRKKQR